MPFQLHPPREYALISTGLVLIAAALWVDYRDVEPVYSPYSGEYQGHEINPIDRLGYTVRDDRAGNLADVGLFGGPVLPILLSFDQRTRPHYPLILVLWLQTMLLTFALTSLIKNTANRPRPYIYNANWHPERLLSRKDRAAFLSGHAANATAGGVLFAALLEAYDRPLATYGRLIAVAVAGFTAFLRVKAGRHWVTDATAGILLGGAVAGAVIRLHRPSHLVNEPTVP
ncbi:phosphatase PAP2 family protein [Neolewinella litorea]|uniref:Phosphatase PAP2 family protein n=1 Tax=Neolewinella litorea TaxID=2562452 RepID=A0A4S4NVY8_9BACT|nr:phosphatase PAP2 family protein [Neolewinella litorea]THH40430.1 phosphatase PAP2 family protein [Neolewinella litorea]